jgi:hypothetical protein
VALYTLGSPHVGVPVEVLAELVELLTLGAITLEDYCIAQPVVCQFSDNEAANPPGFSGIETFNNLHNPRAAGVAYHLVGGDIGFDHRGWLAEILYQLIPGPNDGIVPLPSAMGSSSADDGGGPPLPLLGPLAGPIDRLQVYAAHIEAFTDNLGAADLRLSLFLPRERLWCTTTGFDAYLDETFRSSSLYGCLEPTLNNRLADNTCGEVSDLGGGLEAAPELAARPAMQRVGEAQFGSLAAGQQAVHSVWLEAGPALLLAHAALDDTQSSLAVTLVSPSGQVLDAAYAAAHPDQVRYKGDGGAGLYLLANAGQAPGRWWCGRCKPRLRACTTGWRRLPAANRSRRRLTRSQSRPVLRRPRRAYRSRRACRPRRLARQPLPASAWWITQARTCPARRSL